VEAASRLTRACSPSSARCKRASPTARRSSPTRGSPGERSSGSRRSAVRSQPTPGWCQSRWGIDHIPSARRDEACALPGASLELQSSASSQRGPALSQEQPRVAEERQQSERSCALPGASLELQRSAGKAGRPCAPHGSAQERGKGRRAGREVLRAIQRRVQPTKRSGADAVRLCMERRASLMPGAPCAPTIPSRTIAGPLSFPAPRTQLLRGERVCLKVGTNRQHPPTLADDAATGRDSPGPRSGGSQ
jgi:hypothetical protein